MYKISVPVTNKTFKREGRENTLKELKKLNAERVFIGLGTYSSDEDSHKQAMELLKENCEFLHKHGYEVGSWNWTFWLENNTTFRNIRTIDGAEIKNFMCPSDENFVKFVINKITDIARCGVDIIQFDDDFRFGFMHDSPGCLCDGHIAEINRITGEDMTREQLREHIISGGKNKYRDAYLKANGDSLRKFSHAVRKAVDEINPNIRISFCSCMSSWDVDGTNAREIAEILAGNTKPILRLIGAPYWGVRQAWGNYLQDVIELERMESSWTKDGNVEIMAEGDAYPRPRTKCPASFLECFDTAIRVAGCTAGIFKYGIDYFSNSDYETGYSRFHQRNSETYKKINEMFSEKISCGVRIYESMNKIADMVMPTKVNKEVSIQDLFFSKAARTLAFNTIPSVYEGSGVCGIAFDENARNLPIDAINNGLILDIAAAEILTERGIDVGIEKIGAPTSGNEEHFIADNNYILSEGEVVYDVKINKNAEVLSDMETPLGIVPISYRYENSDGQRFFVLNINTRKNTEFLLKQYARGRQYSEQVKWLSSSKLPAYCYGNPALYMQCKKGSDALAVGLWNLCADVAIEPVIELDNSYSQIKFINCNGKIDGDKVYLSDIQPYAFAAFEVK